MNEKSRIDELKSYVGSKEVGGFMIKLVAIFFGIAALITVLLAATNSFTPRRGMLLAILWGMAIFMGVYTALEMKKMKGGELETLEKAGRMEEVLEDFDSALKLHGDQLRVGESYVFARKGGGLTPYTSIRRAGMRVLPLQEAKFIQYYIELDGGNQRVIYQETEERVNKADIEAITFNLAAKTPGIKFNGSGKA